MMVSVYYKVCLVLLIKLYIKKSDEIFLLTQLESIYHFLITEVPQLDWSCLFSASNVSACRTVVGWSISNFIFFLVIPARILFISIFCFFKTYAVDDANEFSDQILRDLAYFASSIGLNWNISVLKVDTTPWYHLCILQVHPNLA